jgi:hypothetical protein
MDIKVGPDGQGSYRYMIDGKLSVQFHNAASAKWASQMPQKINADELLEPRV